MKEKALITGITGQDGSYLSTQLLQKGYEVHGIVRRTSTSNLSNLSKHVLEKIHIHEGDVTEKEFLDHLFKEQQFQFIYNLAAQSHVGSSFDIPEYTMEVNGLGARRVFEAALEYCPNVRVYQASTSEMYGQPKIVPQNELTPFNPVSPYAMAKLYAHQMANLYRHQGLFVACGILHNHESPKRGEKFLTRKVIRAIKNKQPMKLGNLSPIRDWGYAPEYTEGMIKIVEYYTPEDFVLATGKGHSVEEFVRTACELGGLDWDKYVSANFTTLVRPYEAGPLIGNPNKANELLGWKAKTSFNDLIEIMLASEYQT